MIQNEPTGDPQIDGPDTRKDVGSKVLFENAIEHLAFNPRTENVLRNADTIVNLFAGNFNESMVFFEQLEKIGNVNCKIIAVDKTAPSSTHSLEQMVKSEKNDRFVFKQEDVFGYLEEAPSNSVDILTAFGAEYVFIHGSQDLLDSLAANAKRLLKPGGILICPGVSNDYFWTSQGFKVITAGIVQKV